MNDSKESKFYNWVTGNIYSYKKVDAVLYIVFYILIPVTITAWSLYAFPSDLATGVYCYLTILISASNCFYDALNRWKDDNSIVKAKLIIMIISICVVGVYCFVIIMGMLITSSTNMRYDLFLCTYFITIIIALFDSVCCIFKEKIMRGYTKTN